MSTEPVSAPDFHTLGLSPAALRAVSAAGFSTPTPIQSQAIPPALTGSDVIGCAATGTGKTAAYLLPVLERLAGKTGTRALVLAPTRELALQIAQSVDLLGREARMRAAVVIGGVAQEGQRQALRERRPILIATPGRLVDHLDSGTARLDDIEILVLDEADRMLDMGFAPQLRRVMARLPAKRQSLLFSATMAGEVAEFARKHLRSPVRVEVARSGTTAPRATQLAYRVGHNEKNALLQSLLTRLRRQHAGLRSHPPPCGQGRPARWSRRATGSTASTPTARSPSGSARWRASAAGRCGYWSRPTSPRAASTSRTSVTS